MAIVAGSRPSKPVAPHSNMDANFFIDIRTTSGYFLAHSLATRAHQRMAWFASLASRGSLTDPVVGFAARFAASTKVVYGLNPDERVGCWGVADYSRLSPRSLVFERPR